MSELIWKKQKRRYLLSGMLQIQGTENQETSCSSLDCSAFLRRAKEKHSSTKSVSLRSKVRHSHSGTWQRERSSNWSDRMGERVSWGTTDAQDLDGAGECIPAISDMQDLRLTFMTGTLIPVISFRSYVFPFFSLLKKAKNKFFMAYVLSEWKIRRKRDETKIFNPFKAFPFPCTGTQATAFHSLQKLFSKESKKKLPTISNVTVGISFCGELHERGSFFRSDQLALSSYSFCISGHHILSVCRLFAKRESPSSHSLHECHLFSDLT